MRSSYAWFLPVVCSILLSACRIDFEAETVVREDGSVERTVAYEAQEEDDKEEILERYELPKGGEWTKTLVKVYRTSQGPVEKLVSTYRLNRIFSLKEFPASDFKRFSEEKDKAAANRFEVRMTDKWFVKWFDYEEQFSDTVKEENLKPLLKAILNKGLIAFQEEMSLKIDDPPMLNRVVREVRKKYEPLADRALDIYLRSGFDSPEFREINEDLEEEFEIEAIAKSLTSLFPGLDTEEGRALLRASLERAAGVIREQAEHAEEDIFGVHGFALFQNYNFKIRLEMPGYVLKTNAPEEEDDGRLIWKFDHTRLNQQLEARSLKIYWERIIATALAGLAVVIFTIGFVLRYLKKF